MAPASPGSTSCLPCRIRRHRIRSADGGVNTGVNQGREARIAARTVTHSDGRTRYHGQSRRGQQPAAQLNQQDAELAAECFATFREGLALIETDDVKALPRVQRDGVKSAVAHQGDRAIRHIEDVLERLGHFKVRHGKRDGE
ncbi:MAG TPA: hypothetical protein VFT22_07260 [Kofleriaceae bacterium]|nr:hypothetical protein [Kofleriaceae bacterium]